MDTVESVSRVSMTEPLSPTVSFFVSNFHHLIPIQLTEHNYTIWKLQCEGALKATSLFDYVQDSQSPTITDPATTSFPNPTYLRRFVVESHIRSCLISTLSPSILAQVTHTRTALELWNHLKHKLTKSNSAGIFQSRRIAASQLVSPVICQICADSGHGASNCRYRSVRSFRPVKVRLDATKASNFASDPSADKLFNTSPHRDFVATADGSADSTGSVFVPLAQETTILSEPDMLVLNQSNSRFVKDRVLLSLEEMIGYQMRQGSGSLERIPVQKKLETRTFEPKKIILMTKPGTDPCGTTRETLPPPPPTDAETTMESLPPTGAGTTRETLPPPPPTGAETTMESLPPTGAGTTRETLPPPPPTDAETAMESLPPTGAGTTRETLPPPPPTDAETTMESLPPTGAGTTRETLPPPPPTGAETTMESLPPTGAGTTRETLPPPPPTDAETTMESLPPTGAGTTRVTLPPPPPTGAETTMESLPPTGAGTTRETLPPPPPTDAETTMESLPPTGAGTTRETLPPPPPTGAETTMESLPPTGAGTTRETLPPPPPTDAETTMESLPPTGAGTTRETLPPPPVGASYLTPYFSKTNKIIWKCAICQVNCVQDQQLQNHLQGKKHKAFELYRELEGKSLQSNKELNAGDTKQNDDLLENVVLEMTVQKGKYECQIGTDASIEEVVDDHKNRRQHRQQPLPPNENAQPVFIEGTKEASNDDTQETQEKVMLFGTLICHHC